MRSAADGVRTKATDLGYDTGYTGMFSTSTLYLETLDVQTQFNDIRARNA